MNKLLTFVAALALAPLAGGQEFVSIFPPPGERTIVQTITEDGDTAVTCKYIGTEACASIAVDAGTGDLTFTDGTCGAESATDTFECPVSGGLGGVIDVSNAACNTMGEVVDIVNASADWRCRPAAALRTDSSNDTLVTISATQATGANGLKLKFDSSVALFSNVVLAPSGWDNFGNLNVLKPWAGSQSALAAAMVKSTYTAGSSGLSIIEVDRTFTTAGSETTATVWPTTAAGATTVAKVFGSCDTPATGCDPAWGPLFLCNIGRQCILRLTNTNEMSVNTVAVNGRYRLTGGPQ